MAYTSQYSIFSAFWAILVGSVVASTGFPLPCWLPRLPTTFFIPSPGAGYLLGTIHLHVRWGKPYRAGEQGPFAFGVLLQTYCMSFIRSVALCLLFTNTAFFTPLPQICDEKQTRFWLHNVCSLLQCLILRLTCPIFKWIYLQFPLKWEVGLKSIFPILHRAIVLDRQTVCGKLRLFTYYSLPWRHLIIFNLPFTSAQCFKFKCNIYFPYRNYTDLKCWVRNTLCFS